MDDSGAFEGSGLSLMLGGSRMGYAYSVDPPSARLARKAEGKATAVALSRSEIVFLGGGKETLLLRYQEFGREQPTRPLRVDEKTYRVTDSLVHVHDVTLRVISIDQEKLRFIVVSDGLPNK